MPNRSWLPSWGDRNRDVEHFRGFKTQIELALRGLVWPQHGWRAGAPRRRRGG